MPTILPRPRTATVIKDIRTQYHHPIAFKAGETVAVGRYDDQYPGWVWTTTTDNNSGWAPICALEIHGETAIAREDYNARELDANAGELLTVTGEESGWYWAEKSSGAGGWVPAEHVRLLD